MLKNYIDEYTVREMEKQLKIEQCLTDPDYLKKILSEIRVFLKDLQKSNIIALENRKQNQISKDETYSFFRSQERIEQTKRLIQYLYSFLKKIPLMDHIKGEVVNPFEQFKCFVCYVINLLHENDVKNAIYKQYGRVNRLNESNQWYYRGRIIKVYEILRKKVEAINAPTIKDYRMAFDVICNLSLFWFSIKNLKFGAIRRSDKYMYILARILMEKIKKMS
jgi:hypothetical protein